MIDDKNLGYVLLRLAMAQRNNGGTFQQHELADALKFVGGWTLDLERWLLDEGYIREESSIKFCLTKTGERIANGVA